MALGARGVVSVVANVAPRKTVSTGGCHGSKETWKRQDRCTLSLRPWFESMFLETNPIPVKTASQVSGTGWRPFPSSPGVHGS